MRPRYTAANQAAAESQRRLENSKKDITHERTDIAGFTLLFKDQETERKWRFACSPKRTQMTGRFLFMSGLYQALFFIADVNDNGNSIFFKGCWRLACGLACLTLCFLVSTSLVVPSQIMLFYVQLLYGGLSLFLHFLGREHLGIWDFLILVYGLCFFMLPKISPLNFIHSCMGSAILCAGYIYISAFWLYGQQWMLSTIFLLIIAVLFMYISYSAEKSSRERWLLRERLNREHIDLQLVASSLQGDMAAAARYRSGPGRGGRGGERPVGRDSGSGPTVASGIGKAAASQTERMNNFFKGIAAWAICMSMGYAFQLIGADAEPPGIKSNSKAFALLMHSMGFSIFLLYFTGQMRWFVINGVVGMLMLWIFNETGLDNRWAVISTHSIGYFILALVVVSSILVFGGVVLVWSHLIEFLMNIMNRYPEVKDEIRQEKILEQVLVRYLADMPSATVLHRQGTLEDEETGGFAAESMGPGGGCERLGEAGASVDPAVFPSSSVDSLPAQTGKRNCDSPPTSSSGNKKLSRVLEAKKPNSCFFCSKNEPVYLLPACSGWTPRGRRGDESLPMCTPYSELAHTRDALNAKVLDLTRSLQTATNENSRLCAQIASSEETHQQLRDSSNAEIGALKKLLLDSEKRLEEEMNRRDRDINIIISQHNTQLSEVKHLYKKLQTRQRQFLAQHEAAGHRESKAGHEGPTPAAVARGAVGKDSVERDNISRPKPECGECHIIASPVERRVSDIDRALDSQGSDDTTDLWTGELSDMQRDFDRLWLESFEEVQNLLQSTVPIARREEGSHLVSDHGRMKYAVHLTEDSI